MYIYVRARARHPRDINVQNTSSTRSRRITRRAGGRGSIARERIDEEKGARITDLFNWDKHVFRLRVSYCIYMNSARVDVRKSIKVLLFDVYC